MFSRADKQPGVDLLSYTKSKIGSSRIIHGNYHHSLQGTSHEGCDPLGGIFGPQDDAITFTNRSLLQKLPEALRKIESLRVGPADISIISPVYESALGPVPRKVFEVFG